MANFLLPLVRCADQPFELRNSSNGRLIARTVIPAFEPAERRKGLLGRDSLARGSAMVIAPTNAIHTFWMRFAIDVLFIRRTGVVAKVRRNVLPWRVVVGVGAYAVVEMAAGTLSADDVEAGDVLVMQRPAAEVIAMPPLARVG